MGISIGYNTLTEIRLGRTNISSVCIGKNLMWPIPNDDSLDVDTLVKVLSCITMGHWEDVLPWNDNAPWIDNYVIN